MRKILLSRGRGGVGWEEDRPKILQQDLNYIFKRKTKTKTNKQKTKKRQKAFLPEG